MLVKPYNQSVLVPTLTARDVPLRSERFLTIVEALDYAAASHTGVNFYNGNAELEASATYGEVRDSAITIARSMRALNLPRGSKVALVATTTIDFLNFFFACQYAALVPVPLSAIINMSGGEAYVRQMRNIIKDSQSRIVVTSEHFASYIYKACEGLDIAFCGTYDEFKDNVDASSLALEPVQANEVAYIQYTSGSTSVPRGVMVESKAVMTNLKAISLKVHVGDDQRNMSWLPFYHDMGLVGFMLAPMASQTSVDYLGTREFAVRPRLWLRLMSMSKATVSYSPPFGYELCARRLKKGGADQYDLSNWRVAGVGAEMIRPEILQDFAEVMAPSGFSSRAFLPSYGMAECSLAISFSDLNKGLIVDTIDRDEYEASGLAFKCHESTQHRRSFVSCGRVISGHDIQIRDDQGRKLADRNMGIIYVKGPSLMSGYIGPANVSTQTLSEDGWLNTGDLGYIVDELLFVTGRQKDLIIINGCNIWPQDLEGAVESKHDVRSGKVLAFSLTEEDREEHAVVVIESREKSKSKCQQLIQNVQSTISAEFGIACQVVLVSPRTLPRTSSGKLSRSQAKINFIQSLRQLEQAS